MSYSNSYFSISISIYSSAFSIYWANSCSYDGSTYLPDVSCSNESTICTSKVSFVCTSCTSCYTCSCCSSFSYLHISYSFRSFSFKLWKSFSVSSILCFSLCVCTFLLSHCCLFASISKTTFFTSGYAQNLKLFSSYMFSTIFLLPFSHIGMFTSVVVASGALRDVASLPIPKRGQPVHWVWRSHNNISMGIPPPNDMPCGSS